MDNSELFNQLHNREYYYPSQPELLKVQMKYMDLNFNYNQIPPSHKEEKVSLLKKLFGQFGEGSWVETPYYANWGGRHVYFGKHVYANSNLIMVDDTYIKVDDYTQMGPNVTLVTATHPTNAQEREKGLQINMPIKIGRNCFLGAGTIVLPGVTIGDNVVVGAGSIVNKDLPDNVIAVGVPAKIIKREEN